MKSLCGSLAEVWSKHMIGAEIKDIMPRDRNKAIMQHVHFHKKDTWAEHVKSDKFAAAPTSGHVTSRIVCCFKTFE